MKWVDKSKEERKKNSRNGDLEVVDCVTYRKWCENCGAEYETVNHVRKLCNECWKLKCEGNGYKSLKIGMSHMRKQINKERR